MNDLAESLNNYKLGDEGKLKKAAEDWMNHVIKTYNGKLRKKAVVISFAIMDFIDELERV